MSRLSMLGSIHHPPGLIFSASFWLLPSRLCFSIFRHQTMYNNGTSRSTVTVDLRVGRAVTLWLCIRESHWRDSHQLTTYPYLMGPTLSGVIPKRCDGFRGSAFFSLFRGYQRKTLRNGQELYSAFLSIFVQEYLTSFEKRGSRLPSVSTSARAGQKPDDFES